MASPKADFNVPQEDSIFSLTDSQASSPIAALGLAFFHLAFERPDMSVHLQLSVGTGPCRLGLQLIDLSLPLV